MKPSINPSESLKSKTFTDVQNHLEVSIIIPAFNAAATIAETLESVLAQTHPYWEAIVVDDGSTDATADAVETYIKRDQRIRMVHQQNGGEAAGRNGGLPLARFDWILFLDSDDWISPVHLERMTEELLAHPELDAVHCGSARVAPDGTQIVQYFPPSGDLFPLLARRAAFNVHACIFRKSLVDNAGMLDPSLKRLPDWDFWQRIARTGARFGAVGEVLAFYRMRPNSASLDAKQLLKDGLRILKQGHAPDLRVKNPHPDHFNGMPAEEVRSEQFYFLSWCAGLVLGAGEDARSLLAFTTDDSFPELWPPAVAQCIFESAPLSQSLSPQNWESLAHNILKNTDEFLLDLEKKSLAPDLARRAGNELRKMILQQSPAWQPVIENYEKSIQKQNELNVRLENEKNQLWRNIEDRAIQIEGLENEKSQLQKTIEDRVIQIEGLERIKEDRAIQIKSLESEKNQLLKSIEDQTIQIERLAAEKTELQKLSEERAATIDANVLRNSELDNERGRWQELAESREAKLYRLHNRLWVRIGTALHLTGISPPHVAKKNRSLQTKAFLRRCSAISLSTILLSILQGLYFLLNGPRTQFHILAIGLAIMNFVSALILLKNQRIRFLTITVILYALQLIAFVFELVRSGPGVAPRLLFPAVILLHAAILLSVLLGETGLVRRRTAVLVSFSIATGLLFFDTAFQLNSSKKAIPTIEQVRWIGSSIPHPILGQVYRPHSTLKTIYPENPRHYFDSEDQRAKFWWIRTGDNSAAELVFPQENPAIIKTDIKKVENGAVYDIQVNESPFQVIAKHAYSLEFQAKASSPRSAFVGFAKAHDSWTDLGLYAEIRLTTDWKKFRYEFTAKESDQNARILFDFGSNANSVEVSSVLLRSLPDRRVVLPEGSVSKTYSVSYRFNELGCRGADYEIPRPASVHRIIALGDDFTLGVGVHEKDTFTTRLQTLLNQQQGGNDSSHYEVINCGVSSYGTREERLFYDEFASKYQPEIVLLMMVSDDYKSLLEDARKSDSDGRTSPNFSGCVEEILKLNEKVHREGARLVVVIFRNDPDYAGYGAYGKAWNELTREVSEGLRTSKVPVLDLGKSFFEKHSPKELMVDPLIDSHPNETAHGIAASEIFDFLKRKVFL